MNFVCIGSPRSGTSWLYERLNEHSDFKLPLRKEIHYFDRDNRYPSPSDLSIPLKKRIINLNFLMLAISDSVYSLFKGGFSDFFWKLKWYFSNYNDDWYLSIFKGHKSLVGARWIMSICPIH